MQNWIEVVDECGYIGLINLNNVQYIALNGDAVSFIFTNSREARVPFDNKYDSLVDFINSKRVDM